MTWSRMDDTWIDCGLLLALPIFYCILFVSCFHLPDKAKLVEWLRTEHIAELLRSAKPYKPTAAADDDRDECVLCLDQFEIGAQVRAMQTRMLQKFVEASAPNLEDARDGARR